MLHSKMSFNRQAFRTNNMKTYLVYIPFVICMYAYVFTYLLQMKLNTIFSINEQIDKESIQKRHA